MINKTTIPAPTLKETSWTRLADLVLGSLYFCCFAFGVPTNLSSLCFFARRISRSRANITTYLYTITSLQDTLICVLALYSGLVLVSNRSVWEFKLCSTHYILFMITGRMSGYLVTALSISRTYVILYPMRRFKVRSVLMWLAAILVAIAASITLPTLSDKISISFHRNDGYCNMEIHDHTLKITLLSLGITAITIPIIPILVSCVVSIHKVKSSQKTRFGSLKLTRQGRRRIQKTNHQMTLTILLMTVVYTLLNTPLLINYLLYLITLQVDGYPGYFYTSTFISLFSWNVSFMLCTAVNACTNPIVYMARLTRYRAWVKGCCARHISAESSVTSRGTLFSSRMFELECKSSLMNTVDEAAM